MEIETKNQREFSKSFAIDTEMCWPCLEENSEISSVVWTIFMNISSFLIQGTKLPSFINNISHLTL